jgi:beta-lactamase class A
MRIADLQVKQMKLPIPGYLLVLIVFCAACANKIGPRSSASQTVSPQSATAALPNSQLQKQIEEIAATAKGRVGVAAILLTEPTTDSKPTAILELPLLASLNAGEHFPMQSVYKLPIGMAVLNQVDSGKLTLQQKVRVTKSDFSSRGSHSPIRDRNPNGAELTVSELLAWMLKESDGTASDVLMRQAGGPRAIQAYLTELNISDLKVVDTEQALAEDHSLQYRNWTTPLAAVGLLQALFEGRSLSRASQTLLLQLMTESNTGPNRLKGKLPPGTAVAHKTGTSGTDKGVTAATNDIGIVTLPNGKHFAIAVFVADSAGSEAVREGVIAQIAKAVWEAVSGRR